VRDRSRQVGRDDRYIRNGIVVIIKNATIPDGMPQVNRNFKPHLWGSRLAAMSMSSRPASRPQSSLVLFA
jgi:hypothetical protein